MRSSSAAAARALSVADSVSLGQLFRFARFRRFDFVAGALFGARV